MDIKNLEKMASLGKKLLRDEAAKQWDEWQTEKSGGDLLAFYQKRLAAFYERPDLAKIIGEEKAADGYVAMEKTDVIFEDKGLRPLPPPFGKRGFHKLLQEEVNEKPLAIYIHIPFCKIKCSYCKFFKQVSSAQAEAEYVEKLLAELELMGSAHYLTGKPVEAVFLGGGTPGTLTGEQLSHILETVHRTFPLSDDCEITVESSIYDMNEAKMETCMKAGANRFSFGVQTFDTGLRRFLGRPDPCETVIQKLKAFASLGPKIIIDLIYGLPGQSWELLQRDLEIFLACGICGMDLYKLQIFPGTPLGKRFQDNPGDFPVGRDLAALFVNAAEFLSGHGCHRLSCCHWSLEEREQNRYNSMARSGAQILAFGAGCGGSLGGISYMQPGDLSRYSAMVEKGEKPFVMAFKTDSYAPFFAAITGQFDRGVLEPEKIDSMSSIPFSILLEPLFLRWQTNGLLVKTEAGYDLTPMGMFWQNQMNRATMTAMQYLVYGPRVAGRKSSLNGMNLMENRK